MLEGITFIRTYGEPTEGEVLQLRREPSKPKDRFAVAVYCKDNVVGHVPFSLAPTLSRFLQRECNSAAARIAGSRLNRGVGFGLEVTCVYVLNRPKVYVDHVKELLPPLASQTLFLILVYCNKH